MTAGIERHDSDRVRVLTFNRPHRLNAFTASSYRLLASLLDEAATDDGVAVVLLAGAGRAFCSGADLRELNDTEDGAAQFSAAFSVVLDALMTFPKPIVVGVHGAAVGFGFTILLHCDVVLVADDAKLRAPFAELGTAPEAGSSWLLPNAVGPQRAAELLLTSRWLSAAEAVDWGLAARACSPESVHDDALTVAGQIATHPTAATQAAKALLRHERAASIRAAVDREHVTATALSAALGQPSRAVPGSRD